MLTKVPHWYSDLTYDDKDKTLYYLLIHGYNKETKTYQTLTRIRTNRKNTKMYKHAYQLVFNQIKKHTGLPFNTVWNNLHYFMIDFDRAIVSKFKFINY